MADNQTFKIGLCMAGAVSAGAYTAGVMDYLVEALEAWQVQKDLGTPGVPTHDVEVSVIGGASAGGMTGIITAAAINDPIPPVKHAPANLMDTVPDNKFYHSWVDLLGNKMLDLMLDTNDIKENGVSSAINSKFIDQIAERAIRVNQKLPLLRKYFLKDLKVFVTLTNVKGMDYSVAFKSHQSDNKKRSRHLITSYHDFACFQLVENESEYQHNGWMPLNFVKGINQQLAATAAMATGAFPVGLKARVLQRDGKFLNDNSWFDHITKLAFRPFRLSEPIFTTHVDGGMINNEPFEKVRDVLMEQTGQRNPADYRHYNTFTSTILMIDPFPSEIDDVKLAEKYNKEKQTTQLGAVVGGTLGALIGQSRVKPNVLIDAWESTNASQFLIAPVRYQDNKPIDGSKAIACGALDGFSGFVSKEFRIHDYFLGRANCERFLRHHFTIPADHTNPIFKKGYAHLSDEDVKKFTASDGSIQMIPLLTKEKPQPYMPVFSNGTQWPTVTTAFLESYESKIKKRTEALMLSMANLKGLDRFLLLVGARVVLNRKISRTVMNTMIEALKEHGLVR